MLAPKYIYICINIWLLGSFFTALVILNSDRTALPDGNQTQRRDVANFFCLLHPTNRNIAKHEAYAHFIPLIDYYRVRIFIDSFGNGLKEQ